MVPDEQELILTSIAEQERLQVRAKTFLAGVRRNERMLVPTDADDESEWRGSGRCGAAPGDIFACAAADFTPGTYPCNDEAWTCVAGTEFICGGSTNEFSCQTGHGCNTTELFDCYDFDCGKAGSGFDCKKELIDYLCTDHDCTGAFTCKGKHVHQCVTRFKCVTSHTDTPGQGPGGGVCNAANPYRVPKGDPGKKCNWGTTHGFCESGGAFECASKAEHSCEPASKFHEIPDPSDCQTQFAHGHCFPDPSAFDCPENYEFNCPSTGHDCSAEGPDAGTNYKCGSEANPFKCDPAVNYKVSEPNIDVTPGDAQCGRNSDNSGSFECAGTYTCDAKDDFDCFGEFDCKGVFKCEADDEFVCFKDDEFNCTEHFECTAGGSGFICEAGYGPDNCPGAVSCTSKHGHGTT